MANRNKRKIAKRKFVNKNKIERLNAIKILEESGDTHNSNKLGNLLYGKKYVLRIKSKNRNNENEDPWTIPMPSMMDNKRFGLYRGSKRINKKKVQKDVQRISKAIIKKYK